MKNFLLVSFTLLLICCQGNRPHQVILEIGELKVSKLDYQLKQNKHFPGGIKDKDKQYSQWQSDYLDRCYILCDALNKEYDTIADIIDKLNSVAQFMMVQKYGPLWKTIISPTVDEFKVPTPEKLKLRENLCYFDVIRIHDQQGVLELGLEDNHIKNLNDFNALKSKAPFIAGVSSFYTSLQWPFFLFWDIRDDLTSMKEGDISELLTFDDEYYIFYLDKVEKIQLPDEDRSNLMTELQLGIEKEIDDQISKDAIIGQQLQLDSSSIDHIWHEIKQGSELLNQHENIFIMSYIIGSKQKKIYLRDFQKYYANYPLKSTISDRQILYESISQYFFEDYLWHIADSLELPKVDTFMSKKNNYYNNLIYQEYLDREIISRIHIDSLKIMDYYQHNLKEFSRPKYIRAHIFIMKYYAKVPETKKLLSDHFRMDPSLEIMDNELSSRFIDINYSYLIDIDSTLRINKELAAAFSSTTIGDIIDYPITSSKEYCFIYKVAEAGQYIEPLDSVYSIIEKRLVNEQFRTLKAEKIAELKSMYSPTINLLD